PRFLLRRHFAGMDLLEEKALVRLTGLDDLPSFAALQNADCSTQVEVGLLRLLAVALGAFGLQERGDVASEHRRISGSRMVRATNHQSGEGQSAKEHR